MLGPLPLLIPRVINQILDDIPMAFSLNTDQVYRKELPVLPRAVVREAVVNALMHRSYRLRGPVQMIRYANRIEIRNPGHSLIPDDRLGEPGSLPRNEKIAAVLHEIGLAETKSTGIRAMREEMLKANLTEPLFESDREKDAFVVTLLVHHLLGPDDIEWLSRFSDCELADDEARALVIVREVGAINNAFYRTIGKLDTLSASAHLRRLRDLNLLKQIGKGSATFYTPGTRMTSPLGGLRALPAGLPSLPDGFPALPEHVAAAISSLGERSEPAALRVAILTLCSWRALRPAELAQPLRRNPGYLLGNYLTPMIREEALEYLHRKTAHPQQAYRAAGSGVKPVLYSKTNTKKRSDNES